MHGFGYPTHMLRHWHNFGFFHIGINIYFNVGNKCEIKKTYKVKNYKFNKLGFFQKNNHHC